MPRAAEKLQLLGLVFAGADLVFEVDERGVIVFVLGASENLTGRSNNELMGSDWSTLAAHSDGEMLATLLRGVRSGERLGPIRIALKPRDGQKLTRHASLSVFRLPQPGARLSCALSAGGQASLDDVKRLADGLLDPASFTSAAGALLEEAERAGLPVRLDLIELSGLHAATSAMDSESAERTRRHVAATLRAESLGGLGASEVATDRFALVRSAEASSAHLNQRLEEATGGIKAAATQLPMLASAAQNLKAMRYALDRYIEEGPQAAAAGFMAAVERTVRDSGRFKAMLNSSSFHLAYQPVVDLTDNTLHHFEALARFDLDTSPADTIRLAEELHLIVDFDLSVVKTVAKLLAKSPAGVKIAANVSGLSLMQPKFVEALIAAVDFAPDLRPRLLLEVTETQAITDLPEANRILGELRRLGHVVCLDDFGAGAASLDYLRHLDVDVVKVDGRFIQSLEERPRDVVLLKHVAALCRELKVLTIAEKVETAETARLAAELGLDFGQGWHFSKPLPEPKWKPAPSPAPPPAARRRGVVERWG